MKTIEQKNAEAVIAMQKRIDELQAKNSKLVDDFNYANEMKEELQVLRDNQWEQIEQLQADGQKLRDEELRLLRRIEQLILEKEELQTEKDLAKEQYDQLWLDYVERGLVLSSWKEASEKALKHIRKTKYE